MGGGGGKGVASLILVGVTRDTLMAVAVNCGMNEKSSISPYK